ncbi:MAG: Gfo/Idh/MocA family oxidoreductase [Clostridia bacterium]|nr:Gfo/Idh/MocA family oxidoreductase [Clostridia bacterium]
MSEKLKLGVVGCGGILTWAHLPAYLNIDEVEIVAFCDIIIERAKKKAELYAKEKNLSYTPAVFEDYHDLLAVPGLDAIDICTPNYYHSIIAVDALNSGINVLCEKPDAVSVIEAEKMKAAAEKSGKTLMVIRNNRFRPVSTYLKNYIEEGKLGWVYAGRCGWQRRRGGPPHGSWFSDKKLSGGGPLIDLGVHMIDLSMWLMGNPKPVSVSGCTYNIFGNDGSAEGKLKEGEISTFDVEDLAMAFVRFDNGSCLQIEVSWASNVPEDDVFFELRGTKAGAINNTHTNGKVLIYGEDSNGDTTDIDPGILDWKGMAPHEKNIRNFVDVVFGKASPVFVPEQGLNMIKILEAIYKSAETGHEIIL